MDGGVESEGMHYEGNCIRPPSEAYSILLQVTVGCSHNKCTFCPTYKSKRFRIKEEKIILSDILFASKVMRRQERVFLMDGDALIIPQPKLIAIFDYLNRKISGLRRVGIYGNAKSILRKSPEELRELRDRKLGIAYLGVETGDPALLEKIRKGATYEQMVEAGRRVKEAGISLSATVLLGLGGTNHGQRHARATGKILSDIDPDFASALTLMVVPGTPLHEEMKAGHFQLPAPFELLEELVA